MVPASGRFPVWLLKIAAKLVLSRLPVPFSVWRRIGIFRPGDMNTGTYAIGVFRTHLKTHPLTGETVLELGPGDSIATGLLAHMYGAAETVLIDHAALAITKPADYEAMLEDWATAGLPVSSLRGCATFDELCARSRTRYMVGGLDSLSALPTASVDFAFSHAVLEHVRLAEFAPLLAELRRVIRPGGLCSHVVDLKDHLGGALNNLRFSQRVWESRTMAGSGFYTNRIRYRQMIAAFERAGFAVDVQTVDRFDALPTPRSWMATPFADLEDNDLIVSGFKVSCC